MSALITKAVKAMLADGWTLSRGTGLVRNPPTCCAVAALVLAHGPKGPLVPENFIKTEKLIARASKILKTEPTNVEAYICGFDGFSEDRTFHSGAKWVNGEKTLTGKTLKEARAWYKRGQALADKLWPRGGTR